MGTLLRLCAAAALLACNAGGDSKPAAALSTAPQEYTSTWEERGWPIEMTVRWRFLSSRQTDEGTEVTGAWEITLSNTSADGWDANIARLTFEDEAGFQIAEHIPRRPSFLQSSSLIRRTLEAQQTFTGQGNFQITVASVEQANSITSMQVWASFKEKWKLPELK